MATSFAPFELQTVAAIPERRTAKWLNVVAHLDPRYGGISAVLPSFCEAIARAGRIDASLAAFCTPYEHFEMPNSIEVRRYPLGNTKWRGGDEVCRALERQIDRSAGIHIHGLWKEHCAAAAQLARKAGKPYLISAHGMLDPWALRQKRWKKLLYSILVERRNLEGARCLHALTEREAENYRRFQLSNPIVVVPHGVALPASTNPAAFFREHPELAGKRIVLFLGSLF
jgi:glycosyltransferase involved in cell wall biosynthesis